MLPSVWGTTTWRVLHLLSLFPKRRQELYRSFFHYMQYVLPCEKCRHAYQDHLLAIPFPKKKEENARWLLRVHNRVNQSIGKPIVDEAEMLSHWEQEYIQTHTLADTQWIQTASYFIEGHPGSQHMDAETIEAHLFLWKHIFSLLPSKIQELPHIKQWLLENPLSVDIVRSKTKYRQWFRKLQKECHEVVSSVQQSDCTTYCRLNPA